MSAAARQAAQREARLEAARARARMMRLMPLLAGGIVLALIIAYAIFQGTRPEPGVVTADDGSDHITGRVPIGQTQFKPWSTDPPTSGPHWEVWYTKGIYDQAADEQLVHSLEHGYVIIHHNCSQAECPDLFEQLKGVYFRYDKKVILNYRPKNDTRIILVAWTRMDKLTEFDEGRIIKFIDAYRQKIAPEKDAP
jgi:hypothetical protein